MKKPGMFIVILICLIVFIVSLSAGIILAARTSGWASLLDSSQLPVRLGSLIDRLKNGNWPAGEKLSIDETRSVDLADIQVIRITSISEKITLTAGGSLVTARLSGSYRTLGNPLAWIVKRDGHELLIYADYPRFGFYSSDLAIQVQVPAEYTGEVQIRTTSGDCLLSGQTEYSWSQLQFGSVSGNLQVDRAHIPSIKFTNVSGSINLAACTGQVSGKTVSGAIHIDWIQFGASEISTTSGDVQIRIPPDTGLQLEYSTVSGSFQNQNLPLQIVRQTRRKLEGNLNQGTVPLQVHTVSGNLSLSGS